MGKNKKKSSQATTSIELEPVTSSNLQPLTEKEEEKLFEKIILRQLNSCHKNGKLAKVIKKSQRTFNGQTVVIDTDTHAVKIANLFAEEANIDIQDPAKVTAIYLIIRGYRESIKANYKTSEKIINELINEQHNKQFWIKFYEACFNDNGSNKEIFITVIRDYPEACKHFFSPTTIEKDYHYLEQLSISDHENAEVYKKLMDLFVELELIQSKVEEAKEEKEEKNDSLIALRKIYDMTHKKTTELPSQAEIDKLASVSRDKDFWKLICDGFSYGKAELFLKNLQECGAYAKLFPPILSQSPEEQAQNDRWILASLADLDEHREKYKSKNFKELYQRAPIAMMILFVKELPLKPEVRELIEVINKYKFPKECGEYIAMWYRYTNERKHEFLREQKRESTLEAVPQLTR